MIDDSMYFVIPSIEQARIVFAEKFPDYDLRILTGEIQTYHIAVGLFAKTKDGQFIIEFPKTLKVWQDKILNSQYADRLKTKEEIWALRPDVEILQ